MTKRSVMLMIAVLSCRSIYAQSEPAASDRAEPPGFRGFPWGASKADVQAGETATLKNEEEAPPIDELTYSTDVAGFTCDALYGFVDGQLVAGGYEFRHRHTNLTDFIDDYTKLKGILTEKYGHPTVDDTAWKDEDPYYKDSPQRWGTAVATGRLSFESQWHSDETRIILRLSGDNYGVSMRIGYASVRLADLLLRELTQSESRGL